jgi:hypothetical protein
VVVQKRYRGGEDDPGPRGGEPVLLTVTSDNFEADLLVARLIDGGVVARHGMRGSTRRGGLWDDNGVYVLAEDLEMARHILGEDRAI